MLRKVIKIVVKIVFCLVVLPVAGFYYSKSQQRLGLKATNEYVIQVFFNLEQKHEWKIPEDVHLKKIDDRRVDYDFWGGEMFYDCEPRGSIYATFNAKRGIFFFPMFNRKKDFRIELFYDEKQ